MAAEVLGGGVQHQVRAELQRALLDGRGPYERDFINDRVCAQVRWLYNSVKMRGMKTAVFSGRDGKFQDETWKWLTEKAGITPDIFRMRPEGDKNRDEIVKYGFYMAEIKDKYNIFFAVDDRPQMVRMWARMGVFVFNVNQTPGFEF